ncbi:MAG TPA: AAA family ATPase [Anaeromyxobacter sp.]|nr:AAA family ATPase [Anaeromyxobacter sp.]
MPFSEVIAQDRALTPLRSALRRGTLHHGYLFGGPEGVGKAMAARLLAQAANCEGGEPAGAGFRDDPCGACGPCRKIAKGIHPDVIVLHEERVMAKAGTWEPKGGRTPSKDVVVDQVRDVVDRRLALKRFEGRHRFVIVDPADAMNPQAQNALLKTLEEPPEDTTLVLVAASPDSLLPTIRSRCVRVAFGPLPADAIAPRLEERLPKLLARRLAELEEGREEDDAPGPAPDRRAVEAELREELSLAVALSGGSLGRALALFGTLRAHREAVLAAAALDARDAGAWLAFARAHGEDRETAGELCDLLLLWWRDVAAAQAGSGALALGGVRDATLRVASALSPAEALRRRREVRATADALRQNASPVLALEGMLVRWFHHGG